MSLKPSDFRELLSNNKKWSDGVIARDPTFFERSAAEHQTPATLWIGCVDSRVPESVITESLPGSILTHRNIANQVQPDDVNVLSVVEFAVNSLHVQHVVVVGHTECGGVKASMNPPDLSPNSPILRWLRPLVILADYLGLGGKTSKEAVLKLVEENVKMQIANLENTETIKKAWSQNGGPTIHGWVYDLKAGQLRDLHISKGPGLQHAKGQ